jgi:hypothetical protein
MLDEQLLGQHLVALGHATHGVHAQFVQPLALAVDLPDVGMVPASDLVASAVL